MCLRVRIAVASLWACGLGGLLNAACSDSSVQSPFAAPRLDAGQVAASEAGARPQELIEDEDLGAAGKERDPTIGGPCVDDEQCEDEFDCTRDSCGADGLCRFEPNSTNCQDDQFCNGAEVCDSRFGCVAGEPVACDDLTACTIDRCLEKSQECEHVLRDADGDGDPDGNCVADGGDCNDADSTISSEAKEICGNERDDNCDGEIDELRCLTPQADRCDSPLKISGDSTSVASTEAANLDYASTCSEDGARDLAIQLEVEGAAVDVELTAIGDSAIALAAQQECGRSETEFACAEASRSPDGTNVARLRLRGLGAGSHSVLLFSSRPEQVELVVRYLEATTPPANETCGSAIALSFGESTIVDLVGAAPDLLSRCEPLSGDLVYFFELEETQDVRLFASTLDGYGEPVLSLRGEGCAQAADELLCSRNSDAQLFARALAPGRYYVSVAASASTRVSLSAVAQAPSAEPAGDVCESAPAIRPGVTNDLQLQQFTDTTQTCLAGGRDAAFLLELKERSDVLLVQRLSAGDLGAVSIKTANCETQLSCKAGSSSPVRVANHGLAAGTYATISESQLGVPVAFTVFERPSAPAVLAAVSNSCDNVIAIPEQGGLFTGSTAGATADFSSGCDLGGIGGNGAPDQLLVLELSERSRVILDMAGSDFETLLSVRSGNTCPGKEIPGACAVGLRQDRSFLDLELAAGQYFVQIDGFAGDQGQWALDVFFAAPVGSAP